MIDNKKDEYQIGDIIKYDFQFLNVFSYGIIIDIQNISSYCKSYNIYWFKGLYAPRKFRIGIENN